MSRKILWLVSWYPGRVDPLTGDFIERHARAVSLYDKITVLFVVKDGSLKAGEIFRESRQYNENLSAEIVYYGAPGAASEHSSVRNKTLRVFHYWKKLTSALRYLNNYLKLVGEYIKLNGLPDLIHVHVVFRAGLIALYLKYRYNIKYIISEHWSLFNDQANPTFNERSLLIKWLIRLIYRRASATTAVSEHLAGSIASKTSIALPVVIPNVFDASLFYIEGKNNACFRFIHISMLNHAKNPEQIIKAVDIAAAKTTKPFTLTVYGPYLEHLHAMADMNHIIFKSEVLQPELAMDLRQHDAMILYSRFEGLPCVVVEAMAAGMPVIGSDIPSMYEMIEENRTGFIVPLNDPVSLAEKMLELINNPGQFNGEYIHACAKAKYSFENVGKQFSELYENVIS